MKLKVYQKYAQNCTITKTNIMNPKYFLSGNTNCFSTQHVIMPTIHSNTIIVDTILVFSNIFLHWETGPQRNSDDIKDSNVPNEYNIENLTTLPDASEIKRPDEKNERRKPIPMQTAHPVTLCFKVREGHILLLGTTPVFDSFIPIVFSNDPDSSSEEVYCYFPLNNFILYIIKYIQ